MDTASWTSDSRPAFPAAGQGETRAHAPSLNLDEVQGDELLPESRGDSEDVTEIFTFRSHAGLVGNA